MKPAATAPLPALAASAPHRSKPVHEPDAARPAAPAAPAPQPVAAPQDRPAPEQLAREATARLQEKGVDLSIEFDDEIARAVFRLVDTHTGELVREIPSKEMLAIARALAAGEAAGRLLDTRA